jgi:hypothetical protein
MTQHFDPDQLTFGARRFALSAVALTLAVGCLGTISGPAPGAGIPDGCVPTTCAAGGKTCGSIDDGCGTVLVCGTCTGPETCGGGGTANVCGAGTCSPTTCAAQGKNCGLISDGCSATLNCGTCTGTDVCGGGGTPNVCAACAPESDTVFCSRLGKNCGSVSGADNCGNTRSVTSCGTCTSPGTCGGGGLQNVCGGAIDQSILPTGFQTDWNPGIPGGIPADNDPVRPATVWLPAGNPYGGYSVNPALTGTGNAAAFTSAFQAAINAAGAAASATSRRIVRLKAGTYYVNPQAYQGGEVGIYVTVDNVTIRGEGADTTRIAANGTINTYGTVILFGHRSGSSDASFKVQNMTASGTKGGTTVQVASAAAYVVGDVITIDVLDGPAVATGASYINGGYLWFYDGQYFKRQPTFGWSGPSTGAQGINVSDQASANSAAQNVVPSWRSTMQTNEITAINGNVLTLKDPLNIDFPLSRSPQVWRTVPLDTGSMGNRWSGIENIAVAGGNNQWGFPGGTVIFSYMAYAWAKNIEADGEQWNPPNPAHPGKYGYNIGIGRSYRCVIRDSYAHGSTDENPGGQAYGIVVGAGSSACLVENNISVNNNKPIALNSTGGGNVIAYNYVDEAVLWNSPGWQENAIDDCHANFTHHDLIEGNWTPNIGGDTTHGNSGWHTHLRNYGHGQNSSGGMTGNLRAVGLDAWTHDHAYIGNVLKGGNVYQTTPTSQNGRPIYQLGNNAVGGFGNWDNGYSLNHVHRDGNWDNVTNGVVWATTARTIPPSFYLAGKPPFFGANPWPWVEPTTGTAGTLPAKARFDASTPNIVP